MTSRTRPSTSGAMISGRLCCLRRWPRRVCEAWPWPVRWWSTARDVTTAPATARSGRDRGRWPTWTRAGSSHTVQAVVRSWHLAWSPRKRPRTRAMCTRPPSSPRNISPRPGRARRAGPRCRCATTTCTDRGCRATHRTPVSPLSFGRLWPVERPPGLRGRLPTEGFRPRTGCGGRERIGTGSRQRARAGQFRCLQHREWGSPHHRRDGLGTGFGTWWPCSEGHRRIPAR